LRKTPEINPKVLGGDSGHSATAEFRNDKDLSSISYLAHINFISESYQKAVCRISNCLPKVFLKSMNNLYRILPEPSIWRQRVFREKVKKSGRAYIYIGHEKGKRYDSEYFDMGNIPKRKYIPRSYREVPE
jgi:hypothetical protein